MHKKKWDESDELGVESVIINLNDMFKFKVGDFNFEDKQYYKCLYKRVNLLITILHMNIDSSNGSLILVYKVYSWNYITIIDLCLVYVVVKKKWIYHCWSKLQIFWIFYLITLKIKEHEKCLENIKTYNWYLHLH